MNVFLRRHESMPSVPGQAAQEQVPENGAPAHGETLFFGSWPLSPLGAFLRCCLAIMRARMDKPWLGAHCPGPWTGGFMFGWSTRFSTTAIIQLRFQHISITIRY